VFYDCFAGIAADRFYAAGSTSAAISNGAGDLWLLLSPIYIPSIVLIFVGAFVGTALLNILAAVGLVAYSLIRAFTPVTPQHRLVGLDLRAFSRPPLMILAERGSSSARQGV
jgi:hypothetical protein